MTKTVAVIPGEDAAPEAVEVTLRLLEQLKLPIRWTFPPVGERGNTECGDAFPDSARQMIDESDATLFGATSGASARALFHLRWGRKTYANVRPTRWSAGLASPLAKPDDVDLVIVRENLEDLYLFTEGEIADLAPLDLYSMTAGRPVHELGDGRFAIKAITRAGSERVIRYGFELAKKRAGRREGRPALVTVAAKYNMLPRSDGLFRQVAVELSPEYAGVGFETVLVDDLAHRLVSRPGTLDVVVLPNLYGDILSDAAAGLAGGLGVAPSGCYGDDYAYFESVHGTAPDLVGRHAINPTATMLSAAMMLDYLGFAAEGAALERAVRAVYADGHARTPDQGGQATTSEFGEAVEARLVS